MEAQEVHQDEPQDAGTTAEQQPAAQEPEDPRTKWYVIHTYSGYENKVRDNLLRRLD